MTPAVWCVLSVNHKFPKMASPSKKTKTETEDVELVERECQITHNTIKVMTIKDKDCYDNKKDFFRTLSDTRRDRIQAEGFRYLVKQMEHSSALRQYVADLIEDEHEWT